MFKLTFSGEYTVTENTSIVKEEASSTFRQLLFSTTQPSKDITAETIREDGLVVATEIPDSVDYNIIDSNQFEKALPDKTDDSQRILQVRYFYPFWEVFNYFLFVAVFIV